MSHPNTLKLHQYRLGELEAADHDAVTAHLAACERCQSRFASQRSARAAFEQAPPPLALPSPAPANGPLWRFLSGAVPVLVLAAAVLLAVLQPQDRDGSAPNDGTHTKGALPDVELWVATSEGPRAVRPEDRLGVGDVVQVLYDANGASHAALAGRDSTGAIEVYGELPARDDLGPAPFGITLDAASGDQEFFVVTSDHAMTADDVKAALSGASHAAKVRSVTVHKR